MAKCPQCNTRNPPENQFCDQCSTPLAPIESHMVQNFNPVAEPKVNISNSKVIRIGRENDNDITFPANIAQVSRYHAEVIIDQATGQMYINDLNSNNGIYINGQRIYELTTFTYADQIHLGSYKFDTYQLEAYLHPKQPYEPVAKEDLQAEEEPFQEIIETEECNVPNVKPFKKSYKKVIFPTIALVICISVVGGFFLKNDIFKKSVSSYILAQNGGKITLAGGTEVEIPPMATNKDLELKIKEVKPPSSEEKIHGKVFEITSQIEHFKKPIEIKIPYNISDIPKGLTESNLTAVTYQNGKWHPVSSHIDREKKLIIAHTNHLSFWSSKAKKENVAMSVTESIFYKLGELVFGPQKDIWEFVKVNEEKYKAETLPMLIIPNLNSIKNIEDMGELQGVEIEVDGSKYKLFGTNLKINRKNIFGVRSSQGEVITDLETIYKVIFTNRFNNYVNKFNRSDYEKSLLENCEALRKMAVYHGIGNFIDQTQSVLSKVLGDGITGLKIEPSEFTSQIMDGVLAIIASVEMRRTADMMQQTANILQSISPGNVGYTKASLLYSMMSDIIERTKNIKVFAEATFPGYDENIALRTIRKVVSDLVGAQVSKQISIHNHILKRNNLKTDTIERLTQQLIALQVTSDIMKAFTLLSSILGNKKSIFDYFNHRHDRYELIDTQEIFAEAQVLSDRHNSYSERSSGVWPLSLQPRETVVCETFESSIKQVELALDANRLSLAEKWLICAEEKQQAQFEFSHLNTVTGRLMRMQDGIDNENTNSSIHKEVELVVGQIKFALENKKYHLITANSLDTLKVRITGMNFKFSHNSSFANLLNDFNDFPSVKDVSRGKAKIIFRNKLYAKLRIGKYSDEDSGFYFVKKGGKWLLSGMDMDPTDEHKQAMYRKEYDQLELEFLTFGFHGLSNVVKKSCRWKKYYPGCWSLPGELVKYKSKLETIKKNKNELLLKPKMSFDDFVVRFRKDRDFRFQHIKFPVKNLDQYISQDEFYKINVKTINGKSANLQMIEKGNTGIVRKIAGQGEYISKRYGESWRLVEVKGRRL